MRHSEREDIHAEIIAGFVRDRLFLQLFFFSSRSSHHKRLLRQSATCWERRLGDKTLNITGIDPQHTLLRRHWACCH